MSFRKIHKTTGVFLLALCLVCLSACSALDPSCFTTVIYVTAPQATVPDTSPSPAAEHTPSQEPAPSASPSVSPEPSLPPIPSVEPYDYALPAPESEEVDDSWFADAVFVGDSRTDGLRIYGGVKEGDFIAYKGLMCRTFSTKACITSGDQKITPREALAKKEYGKVFVMLGLNELDFSVESFAEDYSLLIDQIRETQPNAILYFQSLIPVNDQKAREKAQPHYVTNEKIALFNAEVVRLAQEKQVILLNVAEALTDEAGVLPYNATNDGIHFNREWYQKWFAYLKTHTVDTKRLEATQ